MSKKHIYRHPKRSKVTFETSYFAPILGPFLGHTPTKMAQNLAKRVPDKPTPRLAVCLGHIFGVETSKSGGGHLGKVPLDLRFGLCSP